MSSAERLRAAVATTEVTAEGIPIRFTISIGVAESAGESPSELLSRSDRALYAAKTGGRNRVVSAP
jgi:diguanylate cyclase (GGDEF)-like protein